MIKELTTHYVPSEGRVWVQDCLRLAADCCVHEGLTTLVIFTGTGEGPLYAGRELFSLPEYAGLRAVAVTPPAGRPYKQNPADPASPIIPAGLNEAMREKLTALGIPVVSAHLPFKPMWNGADARTSEWTRVAEAYGVLGGGFALCVQAALVACDAGMIEHGARVVVLSADTALVVRACRTESFLSPYEGLLVEHVICRPLRYDISKQRHEAVVPREVQAAATIETTAELSPPPAAPALPAKVTAKKAPKTTSKKPTPKRGKR